MGLLNTKHTLVLLTSLAYALAQNSSSLVVDLGYAKYQGVPSTAGDTSSFLGIRFAAPPIGDLRFRAPHLPGEVLGIQIADTVPNRCRNAQSGMSPSSPWASQASPMPNAQRRGIEPAVRANAQPPISEDCLFLNVIVPGTEINLGESLPVIVWIHGGGYLEGTSSQFNGNDLIQGADGKAIVVLIQYRLGAYGFLAGEAVKQDGVLNAGLLDQQFALSWVQEHISKFGGDPRRVTIWGSSAGAGSVLQLLVANGGKTDPPLFQSAILSSLYYPPQYNYNDRIPEDVYRSIIQKAGCEDVSGKGSLDCLRELDAERFDEVVNAVASTGFYGTFPIQPVIDGSLIPDSPLKLMEQGKLNTALIVVLFQQAVIATHNTNEGIVFIDPTYNGTTEYYVSQFLPTISSSDAKAAADIYEGLGLSAFDQAAAIHGEFTLICPTYALMRGLDGHGYKGHFAIPPALHGDDAAFYFPTSFATPSTYNNTEFKTSFAGAFFDFIQTGSPDAVNRTGSILPDWPRWNTSARQEVLFNRTEAMEPQIVVTKAPEDLIERCRFWDSIGETVGH
ncbi:hypothetical protein NMY22_g12549 [Coprinellus aureogranulatus]|nr:hypothetical protein NMY22_g12549 [Coprinellus aureogranulatus]